jgi:hypothetical protein
MARIVRAIMVDRAAGPMEIPGAGAEQVGEVEEEEPVDREALAATSL